MKIESSFRRCARKSGGLTVGATIHFPTTVVTRVPVEEGDTYDCVVVTIGLVAWQWTLTFLYGRR